MDLSNTDSSIKDFQNQTEYKFDNIKEIMEIIASEKATYASRIANISRSNDIDRETASSILFDLENEGFVERLFPSFSSNDQRLLDARKEMFRSGMKSIKEVKSANWFGLNSDLDWVLKVESDNSTDPDFVDEYHRETSGDFKDKSFAKIVNEEMRTV